jgi:uncharacterized protein (DUF427 family)
MNLPKVPEELREKVKRLRTKKRERPANIEKIGPGQESVWDYPRPPIIEREDRRIRIEHDGCILVNSIGAYRVLETSSPPVYYMPLDDVQTQYLEPSEHTTLCEWKGIANFWSIRVDDRYVENAAWSYPEPWTGYGDIQHYIGFNAHKVDACFVGSHKVKPQPGKYYGGWITPEVVGPFKGIPGSKQW